MEKRGVSTMWAAGLAAALVAGQASAATYVFRETAGYNTGGATVRSDDPSTGTTGAVTPPTDTIIAGTTGTIVLHGFFEFDLSAIEAAAAGNPFTIDSVTLSLRTSSAAGSGATALNFQLSLLGNNLDFDESTVNWTNAPGGPGGVAGTLLSSESFVPNAVNQTRTFGSTSAFQSAVADVLANDPDNTIRLFLQTESGSGFARFLSDENATESNRPTLTVNYTVVPEPSTGIALAGGLTLLAGLRRRSR
ncbi:DNRLRE domain-containing protein [Luteolibacter sp. SL250]|uniref:DNRLRE domain-containing protein n=1 Tax=Luteolibacter sp. SL250 TaxID=2995170 RepID=UPI00226E9A0A|nr:DNRLRE domain-containing protein [Luteolibacter sp. SL250]WAC19940.1 DNRLRE domain-containing protein [Luteolibacter sp. SL250]